MWLTTHRLRRTWHEAVYHWVRLCHRTTRLQDCIVRESIRKGDLVRLHHIDVSLIPALPDDLQAIWRAVRDLRCGEIVDVADGTALVNISTKQRTARKGEG